MGLSTEHSLLKDALTVQLGVDDLFNGSKIKGTSSNTRYNVYILRIRHVKYGVESLILFYKVKNK